MRDLTSLKTDELYEISGILRSVVSGLEAKRPRLSVEQERMLKDARAEMRRVKREIKTRVKQLPLL